MKCAVIFGGSGFIGCYFASELLKSNIYKKVYLYDIENLSSKFTDFRTKLIEGDERVEFITGDVRKVIDINTHNDEVSLIANFAAVHREPGHKNYEYYETNLLGAKNVCEWSEKVNCKNIIFTSSISPYGVSEKTKDEYSLPCPNTAYGSSKLAAEKIHETWFYKDEHNKNLIIVRPGVVFGPGEGGNVSRLIKAVKKRYFFFMGNKETIKAGIYIKELTNMMLWSIQNRNQFKRKFILFNATMNPGPSIADYVDSICRVSNIKRFILNVPFIFLLTLSFFIDLFLKLLRINHPFSPLRIKKLVRSNNIIPKFLIDNKYEYIFTLDEALNDWKKDYPEEWF
tara:strand:+ start:1342 stop:2364 length:1023 start_codon:yes stop_codon:yes gene_type:complete